MQRPDGLNLGLKQFGIHLYWEYQSGMRLHNILDSVTYMLKFYPEPDLLILHCGGNDIGIRPMVQLTWDAKNILQQLVDLLPKTKFIWSQILPRKVWRYIEDNSAAERTRKRINSCLSTYFIKNGGGYLRYPELNSENIFFQADGVHLSVLGLDILLNTISGAVYVFLRQQHTCSPIFPN